MFQKPSFVLTVAFFSLGLAFGCGEGGPGRSKSPPVGDFASRATTPNVVTFGTSVTPAPVGAASALPSVGAPTAVQPAGGSSSGGLGGLTACSSGSSSSTSKCSESERVAWGNCVVSACSDVYKRCFGDGFSQGSFGGPCGTWVSCAAACACGDKSCQERCGQPDRACDACTKEVATCVSKTGAKACAIPACIDLGGEEDLPDEPVSKPPARPSTPPSAAGACSALATCCDQMVSASDKEACKKNLDQAKAGGDNACNVSLQVYRSTKKCS